MHLCTLGMRCLSDGRRKNRRDRRKKSGEYETLGHGLLNEWATKDNGREPFGDFAFVAHELSDHPKRPSGRSILRRKVKKWGKKFCRFL